MARFLYRLLRVINFIGTMEESHLRSALRSTSVMTHVKSLIAADFSKPLSYTLPLTGNAMSPTLNSSIADMATPNDHLIIRRLAGTTQSFLNRVHVDDLVVIKDPNDARRTYVRRVAALEGATMVSSFPSDSEFVLPLRTIWVLKENQKAEAPDSRLFGPLSLEYVVGRVMYAIRSATDHGRVRNSPYAMASDAIVMAQESVSTQIADVAAQKERASKQKNQKNEE